MNKYKLKYCLFVELAVVLILLLVCPSNAYTISCINEYKNAVDSALIERVCMYYNLEKESDWEKTYLYRTPLYRKSINFDFYKRKMTENNAGWQLLEFKIVESIVKKNYATIEIDFIEKVPQGYFPLNLYNTTKITQLSTWEKIGDIWYCRDACSRTHLILNGDIVMSNGQKPISGKPGCIRPGSTEKGTPLYYEIDDQSRRP